MSDCVPVRCANGANHKNPGSHCKNVFIPTPGPTGRPFKMCKHCRDKSNARKQKYRNSTKGKTTANAYKTCGARAASLKKYAQSDKGKASSRKSSAKYQHTERGKKTSKQYAKSELASLVRKRYHKSEKGKRLNKRMNGKFINKMRQKLYRMLTTGGISTTLLSVNKEYESNEAVRSHFQRTFEPWMHWGNHGKPLRNAAPQTTWSIGHWIPVAAYDPSDIEDVRSCHSLRNLRAQCAKENAQDGAKIPNYKIMIHLRDLWPRAWKNQRF